MELIRLITIIFVVLLAGSGIYYFSSDFDDDSLSNYDEMFTFKTDPKLNDTDGDGLCARNRFARLE